MDTSWTDAINYVTPDILAFGWKIIDEEGGFVDNANDRGGATNCGISLSYAADAFTRGVGAKFDLNGDGVVDVEDIKLITPSFAVPIFIVDFFVNKGLNKLGPAFQTHAFDVSVNSGSGEAITLTQRTFNRLRAAYPVLATLVQKPLNEDGGLGALTITATLHASETLPAAKIINTFCDVRLDFYKAIVARIPTDEEFLKGWINRVNSLRV
jgi:lysozyme family protein